jgi:F-type H+-transporting ATPase subunit delta
MKITLKKYAEALAESLLDEKSGTDAGQKIGNFLRILRKNKKTKFLKRFLPIFSDIWYARKGIMRVKITTPYKYGDEETESLKKMLSDIFKKKIIVQEKEDKNAIGGFKMEFADYVMDGTIKKNLEILESRLSNN